MTMAHKLTIGAAILVALLLLLAMILGHSVSLEQYIGVSRSLRDVSLALWAFLLPAWFTLEEAWFAPPSTDPEGLARFHSLQRRGRLTWVIAAGAVAVILGSSAPQLPG